MIDSKRELRAEQASVEAVRTFLRRYGVALAFRCDLREKLDAAFASEDFREFVLALIEAPAFTAEYGREFATAGAVRAIGPCRSLRGCLNLSLQHFFALLSQVATALHVQDAEWSSIAEDVRASAELSDVRLATYLTRMLPDPRASHFYVDLVDRLIVENPHAIYPTSTYRECDGHFETTDDGDIVEAVVSFRTSASIRMVDRVLDVGQHDLRDIYRPFGRCIALVDRNVSELYGERLEHYFTSHGISLKMLVYRGLEIDKGLATVERMLGDLKHHGVSRNEPILVVGGGVIADTGGLACALYGRNTPYVMLATSIVSGIDAGPSPRTCCDGFGYKNLLGAYHPPIVCITDRFFFKTLESGWIRHGIAEIVKIAIVRNAGLVDDLETAGEDLISTRFGTVRCDGDGAFARLSRRVLSAAMRSYIESEYDNLYETHQCRPHAYGHTWSPGFEIEADLLHGHAVAIDMGFSAYLSFRAGWIDTKTFERILSLIEGFGLSLWHDVLADIPTMLASHRKIVEKRGGNLVAPVPRGAIGACGYLNDLSQDALIETLAEYRSICAGRLRGGRGIDPLCSDVGSNGATAVLG